MTNHSEPASTSSREAEVFRAFRRLDRNKRRCLALRILRDQRVLADLYDHFLIQEAIREKGESALRRAAFSVVAGTGDRPCFFTSILGAQKGTWRLLT